MDFSSLGEAAALIGGDAQEQAVVTGGKVHPRRVRDQNPMRAFPPDQEAEATLAD